MRPIRLKIMLCAWLATFCYTARAQQAVDEPETVMATFRVQDGKAAEFRQLHARAWPAYRRAGLVLERPHIVLEGVDDTGKPFFVEILTWKTHRAPDSASADIRAIWAQLEAACEPREGHRGIEFPEVKIVTAEQ
jgi:hypothetical protein